MIWARARASSRSVTWSIASWRGDHALRDDGPWTACRSRGPGGRRPRLGSRLARGTRACAEPARFSPPFSSRGFHDTSQWSAGSACVDDCTSAYNRTRRHAAASSRRPRRQLRGAPKRPARARAGGAERVARARRRERGAGAAAAGPEASCGLPRPSRRARTRAPRAEALGALASLDAEAAAAPTRGAREGGEVAAHEGLLDPWSPALDQRDQYSTRSLAATVHARSSRARDLVLRVHAAPRCARARASSEYSPLRRPWHGPRGRPHEGRRSAEGGEAPAGVLDDGCWWRLRSCALGDDEDAARARRKSLHGASLRTMPERRGDAAILMAQLEADDVLPRMGRTYALWICSWR